MLEEKHENYIATVRKWETLAATRVNMSGSERNRVIRNTGISSIKLVTRKLKEAARFIRAKQRQGKVQKVCKLLGFIFSFSIYFLFYMFFKIPAI